MSVSNIFVAKPDIVPLDYIYKTKNYELFEFIEGNRDISKLGKLRNSIKQYGYLNYPIIVELANNGKLRIADGQHRFTVCKEMGLPIIFAVQSEFTLEKIQVANSAQRKWNGVDNIKSKAIKSDDYKRFLRLLELYNFSKRVTYVAIEGNLTGGGIEKICELGTLVCSEQQYEKAVSTLSWLSQFKEDVRKSKLKGSIDALYVILLFCNNRKIVSSTILAQRVHDNFFKYSGYIINEEDAAKKTEDAYNYRALRSNYVDILSEYRKAARESNPGRAARRGD